MRYRVRPREVEAVQWTTRNLDEIRALCPNARVADSGWTLLVPIPESLRTPGIRDVTVANAGDYVVRMPDGVVVAMNGGRFEAVYEPIPETPNPGISNKDQ